MTTTNITKPRLTYFDAPVSRGEECRLALHLAKVDFEDNRVKRDQWPALKPETPFGGLPTLEMPGHSRVLAQSNAILAFVGRKYGLHPKDEFEAARHEAVMEACEELRAQISPTLRIANEEEKKAARTKLSEAGGYIPSWGAFVEKQIADDGPFCGGNAIHVVDAKLFVVVRWIRSGALDHIPGTVLAPFTKLNRVVDAVDAHPLVKSWYAKT